MCNIGAHDTALVLFLQYLILIQSAFSNKSDLKDILQLQCFSSTWD
jgi:hypothetical protein